MYLTKIISGFFGAMSQRKFTKPIFSQILIVMKKWKKTERKLGKNV